LRYEMMSGKNRATSSRGSEGDGQEEEASAAAEDGDYGQTPEGESTLGQWVGREAEKPAVTVVDKYAAAAQAQAQQDEPELLEPTEESDLFDESESAGVSPPPESPLFDESEDEGENKDEGEDEYATAAAAATAAMEAEGAAAEEAAEADAAMKLEAAKVAAINLELEAAKVAAAKEAAAVAAAEKAAEADAAMKLEAASVAATEAAAAEAAAAAAAAAASAADAAHAAAADAAAAEATAAADAERADAKHAEEQAAEAEKRVAHLAAKAATVEAKANVEAAASWNAAAETTRQMNIEADRRRVARRAAMQARWAARRAETTSAMNQTATISQVRDPRVKPGAAPKPRASRSGATRKCARAFLDNDACKHVVKLPECAGNPYGGKFWTVSKAAVKADPSNRHFKGISPALLNQLPSTSPFDGEPFESCALVSSSRDMLRKKLGAVIDAHAVVMRINGAPTKGFEAYVGARTTFRFMHSGYYGWRENEREVLVGRWGGGRSMAQLKSMSQYKVHAANPGFILASRSAWFTKRGHLPTQGMRALLMLVGACKEVSIFGFEGGSGWYFDKEKNRLNNGPLGKKVHGFITSRSRWPNTQVLGTSRSSRTRGLLASSAEEVDVGVEQEGRLRGGDGGGDVGGGEGSRRRLTALPVAHVIKVERECMNQFVKYGIIKKPRA
jgi:hypothetical protein